MASYNKRQRKKLHLAEFQEIGFIVRWRFEEGTDVDTIDKTVNQFIKEAIVPNQFSYEGSGYLNWEGLVCFEKPGKCTEKDQELVKTWLEQHGVDDVEVTELFDIWYSYPKTTV